MTFDQDLRYPIPSVPNQIANLRLKNSFAAKTLLFRIFVVLFFPEPDGAAASIVDAAAP